MKTYHKPSAVLVEMSFEEHIASSGTQYECFDRSWQGPAGSGQCLNPDEWTPDPSRLS